MQGESERRSNPVRTAEMRFRLIAAARQLFVEHGFHATSTSAIVHCAGVTRGALYHHFPDKLAVFRGVVEAEAHAVAQMVEQSDMLGMTAFDRLLAGARTYLTAMQTQGRVRILLLDGPAILGPQEMRAIEAQFGEATLQSGLREAMDEGSIPRLPVDAMTSLLSAVFERAAMDEAEGRSGDDQFLVVETVLRGLSRQSG